MKLLKTITILLPLLLSEFAFGSITDVNPDDKSLEYLRYIFGSIVDVIIGGDGPANPDSILGALSEILNTGMLVFTGLIIGYVFLTGVLNSAHEGTPLGKMYSTMWVPLRMVIALSLVLPFSGGYSTMQIGVLWIAGHGIGLANTTWNRALDYMHGTGTLYPPEISINHEQMAINILSSRMCMHAINTADRHVNIHDDPLEMVVGEYQGNLKPSAVASFLGVASEHKVMQRYTSVYDPVLATAAYTAAALSAFSNGIPRAYGQNPCGSFELKFPEIDDSMGTRAIQQNFQTEVVNAHADLDEDLDPLARQIVLWAVDENAPEPDVNLLFRSVQNYKLSYQNAVQDAVTSVGNIKLARFANGNPEAAGMTVGARDAGWISVGAWYWDIQRLNAENQKMLSVYASYEGFSERALEHDDFAMFKSALRTYSEKMYVPDHNGNPVNNLERSSYSDNNTGLSFVLASAEKSLNLALAEPDPISGLANFGHTIIEVFQVSYIALKALELIAQTADDGADTLGGLSGGSARLISSPALQIAQGATGLLVFAGFLLLPLAIMLAFYLPATPMILWIMGVIGWFVLLIEAVIAAPIWAVSHAMPEGEGFVGERAKAGYMVMLSLFLRPTLMIFGFFAAAVLIIVMGKVVALLFIPAMSGMVGDHLSGLFSLFAMLAIFTVLMIQIAHRVYGLIHEVPDKVLRYIGGGAENLGEANNEQQNRSIFVGGVAKVAGHGDRAARGAGSSGGSAIGQGIGKAAGAAKGAAKGAASSGMSKMSKMLSTK